MLPVLIEGALIGGTWEWLESIPLARAWAQATEEYFGRARNGLGQRDQDWRAGIGMPLLRAQAAALSAINRTSTVRAFSRASASTIPEPVV